MTKNINPGIVLGGAPEGFDAGLLAKELARGVPVIHVARDDKRLEAMHAALTVMAPDVVVLELPAWDCLPYDRVSPNPDIISRRMATLAALAQGMGAPFVLLTTLNAATQRLPAREVLAAASFSATVGHRLNEGALRNFLTRMGFTPSPTVAEPGEARDAKYVYSFASASYPPATSFQPGLMICSAVYL